MHSLNAFHSPTHTNIYMSTFTASRAGVYVMHRCVAECIRYTRQRVLDVYGALVTRRHKSRHVPTRGIVVMWLGCVHKQQTPKQLHKKWEVTLKPHKTLELMYGAEIH